MLAGSDCLMQHSCHRGLLSGIPSGAVSAGAGAAAAAEAGPGAAGAGGGTGGAGQGVSHWSFLPATKKVSFSPILQNPTGSK